MDAYFSGSDEERRALVEKLARDHYLKGKTEAYIKNVANHWRDIQPILQTEAEEKAIEPKLQKLEAVIGEANTRRELNQAKERYAEIPREKLSAPRVERYDRLGTNLSTIETVMTQAEEEAALLGHRPFITSEEAREQNANALLRSARAQGITSAGGSIIGESRVKYRSDTSPKPFIIREYPAQYNSRTQTWTEQPRYRVYREDTGEYIGQFSEKPTAKQIKERWRE